jgi:tRNA dimethylallyltransferase
MTYIQRLCGLKMLLPENVFRPLIVIVGPTAAGKTELSIQLAKIINGEIISADSRLFYRGMDIGTAKPTLEERSQVPHHLIDVAEPDEIWNLALFQKKANEIIAQIHHRGSIPILVGGTGQYIRCVVEAWYLPEHRAYAKLREALERWGTDIGPNGLHQRLAVIDPEAANFIDPTNVRRTIRAIEVVFQSGERFSQQRRRKDSPYSQLILGMQRPRKEIYERVDARIEAMFAAGFVDEVQNLLKNGYSPKLPTLSAIGYREVAAYLSGELTLEEAVIQMKRLTRNFVRRQSNWFKADDPAIHWFDIGNTPMQDLEVFIRSGEEWNIPDDH